MWFRLHRSARRADPARSRHFRPQVDVLEDRCLLSAGALDTTFGGTGVVTTVGDSATAVLIQPWDGKIVVAGSSAGNMSLARYNADGSLDATFGSKGKEVSKIPTDSYWNAAALYSSSDTSGNAKKIVEAGGGSLARFNANGSVDTSFGSRGRVQVASTSDIAGVVIQPADGKIVVAGDNGSAFVLSRYNANGTLDTTFGAAGTVTLSIGSSGALVEALALQADGKLVEAGGSRSASSTTWELARFNPNGTLDTTFDAPGPNPGTVISTFATTTNEVRGLAIYPSTGTDTADYGKILAAGSISGNPGGTNDSQPALARYNADGTPDTTFGQSGEVVTPLPNSGGDVYAVAIQADGKIIAAGQIMRAGGGQWQFGLLRYNTNGSLDTSFGNGGIVQTPPASGSNNCEGRAVAIQADGRIVVVGKTFNSGTGFSNFMTARYLAGPEIGTFTASASTVTAGSTLTLTASNLTDGDLSGTGYATVTQVAFYAVDQSGNQTLLGYGAYSNGAWTLNYTVSLASGSYTLYAQATDSAGIIGDSAFLTLTVQ
jgi:uncharacterized delta-60 repeat protein